MVLGGYPTDSSFSSFVDNTTALLITFPVDANASMRTRAVAWERQFLQVVRAHMLLPAPSRVQPREIMCSVARIMPSLQGSSLHVRCKTSRPAIAAQVTNERRTQIEEDIRPLVEGAGLRLSYSAESSVERELSRESFMDVATVALSYFAMFVYVAVALSKRPPPVLTPAPPPHAAGGGRLRRLLGYAVHSRAALAGAGVCVVLAAVAAALGVSSLAGVPASLIVMEVIPFLSLAIGVDNMFLMATLEAEQPAHMDVPERVGAALEVAGPSVVLASLSEILAFAVAAATTVPAVRNFAIVAAVSVFADFVLQVTAFVALLALDCERMRDGQVDCLPCLQLGAAAGAPLPPPHDFQARRLCRCTLSCHGTHKLVYDLLRTATSLHYL
jgi:Sterol-sensing domain of SREBP cleavage-activation